ncbi:MAG: hypothetical protein CL388_01710 [Acidiferrobacteraceae bacterium]|nr:hypothetical protein [Acidiferrobacteraceae bacterium]MDP6434540.1 sulfite exporter TauE/SafE family protein [Arenicellales bacterium]MDP6672695.1 sulfite exporter TauE/SafE family protein [Arenicellales bacterium]MDP6724291.1 sulfite exporter TauE/SafE family protein [Arenicellales bacterium]
MTLLMTAFMIGFLGSIHCVGMCGGIVGLLGTGIQERGGRSLYRHLPMWIGYNCGRLASYTLAGGLAGVLGVFALSLFTPHRAQTLGLMFAGSFMVLLGLYLTGWWSGIQWLERIGGEVWKLIEPLGRRYIRPQKAGQAVVLGMVWGWLPCGLVYSALALSLSAGSIVGGALVMVAFGVGTLPMLLAMGVSADRLLVVQQNSRFRLLAGVLVISMGLLTIFGLIHPIHPGSIATVHSH